MDARDELLTIAEIAIALAGFAGVVAVFIQRDGGQHPADRIRFLGVFSIAFLAVLLAFWPVALTHAGLESTRLWRIASLGMAAMWFLNVAPMPYVMRELRRHIEVRTFSLVLLWLPAFANLAIQLLNVAGWLWSPGFVAYLVGLLVYIYSSGILFVYAVVFRPEAESA